MIKTIPVNGPGAGSDAGDRRRWAGKKKVRMWGLEKGACGSETKNFGRAAPIRPACAARKTRAGKTSPRLFRT